MSDFEVVDWGRWQRKDHFLLFSKFADPLYSFTTDVEVSLSLEALKELDLSTAIVFAISDAANQIPEFRYRLTDEKITLWKNVSPSITVMGKDLEGKSTNLFRFCWIDFQNNFLEFRGQFRKNVVAAESRSSLLDPATHPHAVLYLTCAPWFSFTSMVHANPSDPADTIPRIAWGLVKKVTNGVVIPLNVQVNHLFIDAIHVAQFLDAFRASLNQLKNLAQFRETR